MIPVVTDLLSKPGVLVGIGVGFCMGLLVRSSIFAGTNDNLAKDLTEEEIEDIMNDADVDQNYKLVLVVRNDLKMGKGKVAAQCSHATLKAYKQMLQTDRKGLHIWEMNGQPKVVLRVEDETTMLNIADQAHDIGLTISLIQDAGRTQIAPGSRTVLGVGPGRVDLVDHVTGQLKLY